jgi:hypothetical protein
MTKNNGTMIVRIDVSKGIVQFMKEHAHYFEETKATFGWFSTPKEFFESAVRGDFDVTLDIMGLKREEIYEQYGIPNPQV